MDSETRSELKARALAGYSNGPDASIEATAIALRRAEVADAVILVEGISDQMAVEATARRFGIDLDQMATVVLPIGGAHGAARYLRRFGPLGENLAITGLCDQGEWSIIAGALTAAEIGTPDSPADLASLGFFVCIEDLEDELVRAHGTDGVSAVLASQGDLGSFRTMQKQPNWRDRPVEQQLRRFLAAGATRKLRYAGLLVDTLDVDHIPRPLAAVLGRI